MPADELEYFMKTIAPICNNEKSSHGQAYG